MVLEFVEGTLLSEFLGASQVPMVSSTLKPDIDIAILRRAYHGMVKILLELPRCQFSAIGGLVQGKTGDFSVEKRAVTSNMNELVDLGNFPPKRLSQHHFRNATSYFESLADDHLYHLETQRNDAVKDEADYRKKSITRWLFRKIARQSSNE